MELGHELVPNLSYRRPAFAKAIDITVTEIVSCVHPSCTDEGANKHEDTHTKQHSVTYLQIHRTVYLYKVPLRG